MAKQKELRLALVCYGGVSLAVYIHGVTREILHLTRASRLLQDRLLDADSPGVPNSTETAWMEVLQAVGGDTEMLVVVDVITAASAGAINGIMLGRALAFDLSMDSHREMWLKNADICQLFEPKHLARPWSKWYLRPVIKHMVRRHFALLSRDPEAMEKLSLFFRSKWFKAPFSGHRLDHILLDALETMASAGEQHTLLPTGQWLTCLITVTDFYGYAARLPMHEHDVQEREHRHIWRFEHRPQLEEKAHTDFDFPQLPGLVFAARCSASYAGAFPPAQVAEMDQVVKERGGRWRGREAFIERNIRPTLHKDLDPTDAVFIDGGIVNNKPFAEALEAVKDRPAHREVDRRILYIEPNPNKSQYNNQREAPNWFRALGKSLSSIPRHEPIRDDLERIEEQATQARHIQAGLAAADPEIHRALDEVSGKSWKRIKRPGDVTTHREKTQADAAVRAGLTYGPYLAVRFANHLRILGEAMGRFGELGERGQMVVDDLLTRWAKTNKLWAVEDREKVEAHLMRMDLTSRIRRLRYVIRAMNELYGQEGGDEARGWIDTAKGELYGALQSLLDLSDAEKGPKHIRDACKVIHDPQLPLQAVDLIISEVVTYLDLPARDQEIDGLICSLAGRATPEHRHALFDAYLGFAYRETVSYPSIQREELADLPHIKVDRISPEDAPALIPDPNEQVLSGVIMQSFGAFFSRKLRENDYLWGRLNATERLFEMVASSGPARLTDQQTRALKKRLFEAVLADEAPHLTRSSKLFKDIEKRIARMG